MLVELLRLNDIPLASILQGRLLAEGIAAQLFDTGVAGLVGGAYPGIRLMVPEDDEPLARRLLDLPENQAG